MTVLPVAVSGGDVPVERVEADVGLALVEESGADPALARVEVEGQVRLLVPGLVPVELLRDLAPEPRRVFDALLVEGTVLFDGLNVVRA